MDYKDIEIDKRELVKQTHEQIRKTDKYIEVSLVIGKDAKEVMPMIKVNNVSDFEIAEMICGLQSCIKILANENPIAYIMSKAFNTKEEKF